jgi:iron(III) transport system substrate-binding protein
MLQGLFLVLAWLGPGAGEPELRVLSDRTESHLAPLVARFEAQAGVEVRVLYLDKGLVSRLEARPTEADIVITKDADLLEVAKQKGLLRPHGSERVRAAVPGGFRDAQDHYFSDSYRARAIFYAAARVKPEELSTYEALADKKWRGRVCIRSGYHDYNLSLFGQLAATLGEERTRAFIRGLAANLARTPSGNDRDQARAIFERKCDVAIANSYYMGIMLSSRDQKGWGQACRVFFPNQQEGGTLVLRSGVALTRATRNVPGATRFMEYLVSEDAQALTAHLTFAYPVAGKVPLPELNRLLGQGQPGVRDGVFRVDMVPLPEVVRHRDAVIRLLDEIQFDKPR